MKSVSSCPLLFSFLLCSGQRSVSNSSPYVATDFKKYLYVNFDNPVYITTGKIKTLKVSIDNGTIRPTKKEGSYLAKPAKVGPATIALSNRDYKRTFAFAVWPMHYPSIRFIGSANMDGVIDMITSEGITSSYEPVDVDIDFQIDSFAIEVKDSIT